MSLDLVRRCHLVPRRRTPIPANPPPLAVLHRRSLNSDTSLLNLVLLRSSSNSLAKCFPFFESFVTLVPVRYFCRIHCHCLGEEEMSFRTRALAFICVWGAIVSAQAQLFDFDSGDQGFTSTFNTAPFDGPWVRGGWGVGGTGGWASDGQSASIGHPCTTDLTSPVININAAATVTLSFDQRYSFESAAGQHWDGGAVYISVNGGDFTQVAEGSFTSNGYNGTVEAWTQGSELGGLRAFTQTSDGYANGNFISSVAELGAFAGGDTIQLRFRAAFDENTSGGSPDWLLDNVNVVQTVPEPTSMAVLALGTLVLARRRRS